MGGTGSSITGEPPVAAAPPEPEAGAWRKHALAAGFLAPAAVFLLVWIVYPAFRTIFRSFFDASGDEFVWFENYENLFTNDRTVTAIKNNFLWLLIVPAFVTAIGLIFAVLTERVRWAVAFKTAVFMPMAISAFAAAVIWRVMDQKDPDIGAMNAMIRVANDYVNEPGVLSSARPSTDDLTGSPETGLKLQNAVGPEDVALARPHGRQHERDSRGRRAGRQAGAFAGRHQRRRLERLQARRRHSGRGRVTRGRAPRRHRRAARLERRQGRERHDRANGTFEFEDVEAGDYQVAIGEKTFAQPFQGVSWLGEKLITPAIMFAYIWIWAGFSMVVIAAGLAAIPRDTLEAARTDGATEWQVFRRITVPLLAPVLSVVFITMLINVLKVFDIVIALAPGSVQDDANVIALDMWRTSFGGISDFGYGSAIAVFLFVLVIPILALNIRRFRREV